MHKFENLTFSELTVECQEALREYCSMTCETVEETALFLKDCLFTFEIIEVEEAKRRCMEESEDLWGCTTFEEYHELYMSGGDIPNHGDSKWPCIEGGDGEWLADGWHRFHSYIANGDSHIPILRFQSQKR